MAGHEKSVTQNFLHSFKILSLNFLIGKFMSLFALTQQPPCGQWRLIYKVLDKTKRRTTFGRNPLDGWSAPRRDLYLTTHNIHNRQISIPRVGFEPTISAGERPKTYALDRAATGTGCQYILLCYRLNKLLYYCQTQLDGYYKKTHLINARNMEHIKGR